MLKQYRLGKGTANIISSLNNKKEIINYLFEKVKLSNYRFQMLKNLNQLEFLKTTEHFVSPNFNGVNYLILFMKLQNKNRTFMIDRRKLKYNKEQLDLKSVLILEIDFKADNNIFQGSIIDGKLLKLENGQYIFICNDCYLLDGNNITDQQLDKKYQTLDKIIASQMPSNPCYNFDFKINKLYNYDKLEELINKIIPKTKLSINGIVFYPKLSGNILIFSNKNNTNNSINTNINKITVNKNNTNINKTSTNLNKSNNLNNLTNSNNQLTNFKINNIENDESYHIVRDLCSYLKSRTPTTSDDFKFFQQKELFLRSSDLPDVYFIYEDLSKPQIGIAHVPNLKVSQELDKIFETNKTYKFNCYYDNNFKKWCPLLD
ncbi:hypothetical protein crov474 [Cafeteria roenbergensis virus]|uniref:Uncharacterized protein n=1 Tax=Cafeteria roenbergensis virus (strain BV-PW1) TaxID=693272 RepID=E3T5P5_CROVB|nr:hypothetical protein crov474 [Cafeteria roenbergensis virus BV-PW1]ADO67508.1 hypothetical protein crov474 [Cafeteria roenbergensis virus BV-PW1]